MPCVAESSRLPYPRQQAERSTDCQASSSTDIQKSCEDRMAVNDTVLELEVAEAYEQTSGREEDRRVFYCQKIGPCLLRRQRSDGQILTSDVRSPHLADSDKC